MLIIIGAVALSTLGENILIESSGGPRVHPHDKLVNYAAGRIPTRNTEISNNLPILPSRVNYSAKSVPDHRPFSIAPALLPQFRTRGRACTQHFSPPWGGGGRGRNIISIGPINWSSGPSS